MRTLQQRAWGFLFAAMQSQHPHDLSLLHRKLTDIEALRKFVHLRFLDVSNNRLTDLSPLASLAQLLWLNASICCASNCMTQCTHM